MALRWVYSSKAGYEGSPYHHFLADYDNFKPNIHKGEFLIESKTKGHFHVIRVNARLRIESYLEELKRRNAEQHYQFGVNLKGAGYLYVYSRTPELIMLERYVDAVKFWTDIIE